MIITTIISFLLGVGFLFGVFFLGFVMGRKIERSKGTGNAGTGVSAPNSNRAVYGANNGIPGADAQTTTASNIDGGAAEYADDDLSYDAFLRRTNPDIETNKYGKVTDACQEKLDRMYVQMLLPLAEQGNIEAQAFLAPHYLHGHGGLRKDEGKGVKMLKNAVAHGNAEAQYHLGYHYWIGPSGLRALFLGSTREGWKKKAKALLIQAADQGHPKAIEFLATKF